MSERNFPVKLWEVINSENPAIEWGESGQTIEIDFEELDKYLQSSESVFNIKSVDFSLSLFKWGFRRIFDSKMKTIDDENPRDVYSNVYFRRNNPNLISLISAMKIGKKNPAIFLKNEHVQSRRETDLCFRILKRQSKMERELNNLATCAAFEVTKKKLKEDTGKKTIRTYPIQNTSWQVETTAEETTNKEIVVGDLAGFYGSEETEKLRNFFGRYIPTYGIQDADTFPPSFRPQATSSKIWNTPPLENTTAETNELLADTQIGVAAFSEAEDIPDEGQSISTIPATAETHSDVSDVVRQLQESFSVLNN